MARRIGAWLSEWTEDDKLVVVSHGIAGKVLRALYANLDAETLLAEDSPQNALFLLRDGRATRVACDAPTVL